MTEADHRRLASCLCEEKRPWVLSYEDHDLVHELYGGWAKVMKGEHVSTMQAGQTGHKPRRPELLIVEPALAEMWPKFMQD